MAVSKPCRRSQCQPAAVDDGQIRTLSQMAGPMFYDPQSLVWSPDSRRVAIYRVKPGTQRKVFRVESAPPGQVHTRLRSQLYPKPGDAVDIETPVLFDIENGTRIEVGNDLFPLPYQLSPLYFRADSATLAFRYVERSRKRVRLIEIDAASGATRSVIEETAETFVNDWWHRGFFHDVGKRGEHIVWMSQRDGWNHLHLFNGNSGQPRQLTRGEWVVRQVLQVDEERRSMVRCQRPSRAIRIFSMSTAWISMAKPAAFCPDHGWHEIALSPDGLHTPIPVAHRSARCDAAARCARWAPARHAGTGGCPALTAAGYRPPEAFVAPGRMASRRSTASSCAPPITTRRGVTA